MGKRISNLLIVSGIISVLIVFLLIARNEQEALQAEKQSKQLVNQLTEQIEQNQWHNQPDPIEAEASVIDNQSPEKQQLLMIDGQEYMGYLSVPTLGLEMPVMSDWSYDKLKIASCRYSGSFEDGNLIIMGHNYRRGRGFGSLSKLCTGDTVSFQAMDGTTRTYTVKAIEVLSGNAVDEMKDSGYDLTLFTCTDYGKNRLTVRCQLC